MDVQPPSNRLIGSLLLASDLLCFSFAYCLAYYVRLSVFNPGEIFSNLVISFALVNLFCLYLFNLYEFDHRVPTWKKPLQTLGAVFLAGCVIVLLAYITGAIEFTGVIGRGVLIGAQLIFAVLASIQRFFLSRWFRRATRRLRWLVVGTEDYLKPFVADLAETRLAGQFFLLTPDGHKFVSQQAGASEHLAVQFLGSWEDLEKHSSESWSGIIACAGNKFPDSLVEVLMRTRLRGIRVIDLTDFYEETWYKVPIFYLQQSWFAMAQGFRLLHNPVGLKLKRVFDAVGAFLLLTFTSPILILAAIAVRIESRGNVIFRQKRVGESGALFDVYKLRSMRTDAEKEGGAVWAKVGDARVTRVGRFIRATRIDELPQLINVLKGEMSFIGPRPERPEFMKDLEGAIPFYGLRHILRPGVTGWAQVMYPYGASIEDARQKLQFDLFYIKNYSLVLDVAIIFKTIRVVLFGKGR